jgi:hypothetical protein
MDTARTKPSHSRRTLGFLLRDNSRLMRRRFVHHARDGPGYCSDDRMPGIGASGHSG